MKHLGIEPKRPRIAVFDFTGCEGCELQLVNKEETLVDFLIAVDVFRFREASSAAADDYEIAFVEGAVSRHDEVERLREVRARARVLVALGSCACFGGVTRMKNAYDPAEANRIVYGGDLKDTAPVRSVKEVVPVDMEIPGCPVNKSEVERAAQVVESVHVVHESIRLIDEVVRLGPGEILAPVVPRAGAGTGAVEAPRGLLFHHYEYDEQGRIVNADCVIPTTQNNANIHHDLEALVRQFATAGMTDRELERLCSMLVRAYDPCLSCSVHSRGPRWAAESGSGNGGRQGEQRAKAATKGFFRRRKIFAPCVDVADEASKHDAAAAAPLL